MNEISRNSEAEKGEGSLLPSTIIKSASPENSIEKANPPIFQDEAASTVMDEKFMNYREKAMGLLAQLHLMKEQHKQLRLILDQLETTIDSQKTTAGRLFSGKLEKRRQALYQKLNKCSRPAQDHLESRISLLYAKAEKIKSRINNG